MVHWLTTKSDNTQKPETRLLVSLLYLQDCHLPTRANPKPQRTLKKNSTILVPTKLYRHKSTHSHEHRIQQQQQKCRKKPFTTATATATHSKQPLIPEGNVSKQGTPRVERVALAKPTLTVRCSVVFANSIFGEPVFEQQSFAGVCERCPRRGDLWHIGVCWMRESLWSPKESNKSRSFFSCWDCGNYCVCLW